MSDIDYIQLKKNNNDITCFIAYLINFISELNFLFHILDSFTIKSSWGNKRFDLLIITIIRKHYLKDTFNFQIISANHNGEMKLLTETEVALVCTYFKDLANPTWSK